MVGRILVVGGGIAGLSAAIALNDAGLTLELVEARSQWPVTGAVIDLAPRADAVKVEFGDESTGEFDLVVGADGLRSTVRRLAVSAESPRNAGTLACRSVGRTRPPNLDGLQVMLGE